MARTTDGARPRRLPLFRIGLTLVIGSVVYSLMRFYVGLAAMFDPAAREEPPAGREDLARYFAREFLFVGGVAGVLFWGGIALMLARVVLGWGTRKVSAARSSAFRAGRAPSSSSGRSRGPGSPAA